MNVGLILVFFTMSLMACQGQDEPTIELPNEDLTAVAIATISTFLPEGETIYEKDVERFGTGDIPTYYFIHIGYGVQNDCLSGCFHSHLCAISEGSDVVLYSASWWSKLEEPTNIHSFCPDIFDKNYSSNGNTSNCELEGKTHPLTENTEFIQFISEQESSGAFRYCF